jgi:hypothetical protein
MKNILSIILTLIFVSCASNDDKPFAGNLDLLGKWKLIEQLSDPGDGSGVFNPISSDRTLEFFSNGTVKANGILCYMSYEVGPQSSGSFIAIDDNEYFDGEITPYDCEYSDTKLYYAFEGQNLIITYLCIEGCGQKFKKI